MNSDFLPKVSIVIPVYNGANYLKESIDCALAQTYPNFEVIVVNDGSTDNGATREIALSYGEKIRYFEKENGGVSSALNYGIRQMTGEYFSWLSHDDKYEADKLLNSVSYLGTFDKREKTIALCSAYYINHKSERLYDMNLHFDKNVKYSGIEVLQYLLKYGILNACCMLIPKSAFDECGYFNEKLRYNQDALMLYQIFGTGYSMVVDPEHRDVMYRLHANQASKNRRDLLVKDSYAVAKIIAPVFVSNSAPGSNLLKMYAKRNAKFDLKDAVNHCLSVGKETGLFGDTDVIYIKVWVLLGKIRNILKKVYHSLRFKK